MSTKISQVSEEVSSMRAEFSDLLGFDPTKKNPGNAAFNKVMEKMEKAKQEEEQGIIEKCVEGVMKTFGTLDQLDRTYVEGVGKVRKSLKADLNKLKNYKAGQTVEEKEGGEEATE